jgi:hypothetical protein
MIAVVGIVLQRAAKRIDEKTAEYALMQADMARLLALDRSSKLQEFNSESFASQNGESFFTCKFSRS